MCQTNEASSSPESAAPLRQALPDRANTQGGEPSPDAMSPLVAKIGGDLDRLAALGHDWDGYGSPPIDPCILAAARLLASALFPEESVAAQPDQTPPRVVPVSGGGLQFEWRDGDRLLEVEFDSAHLLHTLCWHPAAGVAAEELFPVSDRERLAGCLNWFRGDAAPPVA